MSDQLSDAEIALLCAIGERDPTKLSDADRRDLARLFSGGYVENTPGGAGKIRLTDKAHALLGERGAGLNEG